MKIKISKGHFACVGASVSMVTDIPFNDILTALYTGLPHPFPAPWSDVPKVPCLDEVFEWVWNTKKTGFMPFHRAPTCSVCAGCPNVPVYADGNKVWLRHLSMGKGLLEGTTDTMQHMCAWGEGRVFDPRGYHYKWEDREKHNFEAHTFWLAI